MKGDQLHYSTKYSPNIISTSYKVTIIHCHISHLVLSILNFFFVFLDLHLDWAPTQTHQDEHSNAVMKNFTFMFSKCAGLSSSQ